VLQADQLLNLHLLTIHAPDFEYPVTFPNLCTLTIIEDLNIIYTLPMVSAPSLRRLALIACETKPDPDKPELYLAPLLARYPRLCSLTLDARLSDCIIPPSGIGGHEHTSLYALEVQIDHVERWEYSPFLRVFPNLGHFLTFGRDGNVDTLGQVISAKNVTSATFLRGMDRDLARISAEAFPNLKSLVLGNLQYRHSLLDDADQLFDLLTEMVQIDGILVPVRWPRLQRISFLGVSFNRDQLIGLIRLFQARSLQDFVADDSLVHGSIDVSQEFQISTYECILGWGSDHPPHEIPTGDMYLEEFISVVRSVLQGSVGMDPEENASLLELIDLVQNTSL